MIRGPGLEKGAAAVEMAIVSMFLLVLLLGIVDIGRAITTNISLRDAVQEGAMYGAFTPGVTRDYTASTTAVVTSTAQTATLTVSDPSTTHTGKLVNGAYALPEPLQVALSKTSWTGPVANEKVDIGFKQLIKAGDALRTGTYSKTLTFTLSTTSP